MIVCWTKAIPSRGSLVQQPERGATLRLPIHPLPLSSDTASEEQVPNCLGLVPEASLIVRSHNSSLQCGVCEPGRLTGKKLTVFFFCLLRQHFEIQEPGLNPGEDEGNDGQHIAERPLGEKLEGRGVEGKWSPSAHTARRAPSCRGQRYREGEPHIPLRGSLLLIKRHWSLLSSTARHTT